MLSQACKAGWMEEETVFAVNIEPGREKKEASGCGAEKAWVAMWYALK